MKSVTPKNQVMKLLVVGDCHGQRPDIDEEGEEADLILATGDICGDPEKVREAMFQSIETGRDWWDVLGRTEAKESVQKSLEQGREVLQKLNSFGKPVFLVTGNWDWTGGEAWEFLAKNRFQELVDQFNNIHNIDRQILSDGNFSYIGYGPCSAPELPQYEDDKPETEEELEEIRSEYRQTRQEILKLFEESENPVIFLSHNVPHDTSLDRIENPDSPAEGRHYGSIVARDMIEKFNPILSIAGHIHEGYGSEKIFETLAVNAGLESHVMIELKDDSVRDITFYPEI